MNNDDNKPCIQGCSFRVIEKLKVIDSNKISKESLEALKLILLERCLKGSVMINLRLSGKNTVH